MAYSRPLNSHSFERETRTFTFHRNKKNNLIIYIAQINKQFDQMRITISTMSINIYNLVTNLILQVYNE